MNFEATFSLGSVSGIRTVGQLKDQLRHFPDDMVLGLSDPDAEGTVMTAYDVSLHRDTTLDNQTPVLSFGFYTPKIEYVIQPRKEKSDTE